MHVAISHTKNSSCSHIILYRTVHHRGMLAKHLTEKQILLLVSQVERPNCCFFFTTKSCWYVWADEVHQKRLCPVFRKTSVLYEALVSSVMKLHYFEIGSLILFGCWAQKHNHGVRLKDDAGDILFLLLANWMKSQCFSLTLNTYWVYYAACSTLKV